MASRSIKNRPSIKKKHPSIGLLSILVVFLAVIVAGGVGVYALGSSWLQDLPDYTEADAFNTAEPTEVYANDGTTLLAKFQLENREPVELDQISPYVLEGTVATEDERFYEHGGFDIAGIARAVVVNLTGSGHEGASTITQQFVRNTILSEEMDDISFKRKIREMYLSVKLEEMYSKDEILRMYLNTINYGSGAHGIQAASKRYFSKNASDLTLAEAALLIGIPQSPTYNNPIDNRENSIKRRNLVLDRMLSNGYITQEEHDAAQAEEVNLVESIPSNDGILLYPYFTSYVRDLLTDPDGPYKYSVNEVFKGGLRVITTIDPSMQQKAEAAAAAKLETLNDAVDAAIVATDPATGHVKAMVGGKDYETQKVNLATGSGGMEGNPGRPCGSSFKTFTLIAALEAGISPQTMFDCSSPANIPGYSIPLHNSDNASYGTRSIASGFAVSSNTGFVRLEMSLGTNKVYEVAKRMGITSPLSETDPNLTLGQFNVTMLDMSKAYAAIANGGTLYESEPILQIIDRKGNVIRDNSAPEGTRVISPEVAHAATEVMKGVITGGTGTAAQLWSGQTAAGKTGTSSDYKDITFCGITPQLSVSIWLGDPENETQVNTTAADVFSNFVGAALEGQPLQEFPSAGDPPYQNYTDATFHIGGYWSSSNSSSDSTTSEEEEKPKEEKPKEEKPETPQTPEEPTQPPTEPENPGGNEPPVDPTPPPTPPDGNEGGSGETSTPVAFGTRSALPLSTVSSDLWMRDPFWLMRTWLRVA